MDNRLQPRQLGQSACGQRGLRRLDSQKQLLCVSIQAASNPKHAEAPDEHDARRARSQERCPPTKIAEVEAFLKNSIHEGKAIHEVERGIWKHALQMGRLFLEQFLALHGTGDRGETVTLPDSEEYQRLAQLHQRRYVSIFGEFSLQRTVYGTREGQKREFVPLDNQLQLPESVFSYVLQDWDQALGVPITSRHVRPPASRPSDFFPWPPAGPDLLPKPSARPQFRRTGPRSISLILPLQ